MGYRLEMSKVKYHTCGGKLYGYCDTKELKSYQWLLDNGYLEGIDEKNQGFTFAECNGNPQIVLRPSEFKQFIELYNEDCNELKSDWISWDKDNIINKKEIQELINGEDNILLEWC